MDTLQIAQLEAHKHVDEITKLLMLDPKEELIPSILSEGHSVLFFCESFNEVKIPYGHEENVCCYFINHGLIFWMLSLFKEKNHD